MSYKMFAYIEKQKSELFLAIQEDYWPSESEKGEKTLDMNKEGSRGLSRNKSSTTKQTVENSQIKYEKLNPHKIYLEVVLVLNNSNQLLYKEMYQSTWPYLQIQWTLETSFCRVWEWWCTWKRSPILSVRNHLGYMKRGLGENKVEV